MPYNDNFQPLYFAGLHNAFNPWIDIKRINNTYYITYNNQTPVMPLPPLTIDGSYPSVEDVLIGLVNVRDKMKTGNYIGTLVKCGPFHTEYIKKLYGEIPGVNRKSRGTDYVYDINEQIELKGSKFKRSRKDLNRFIRENETHIIDIKPKKQIKELMSLNYSSIEDSNYNAQVFKSTICNFNKLKKINKNIDGFIVIDKNEKILGIEIFYKIKHTSTLTTFIKRSAHNYLGLANYIDNLMATKAKEKHPSLKFINAGTNKSGSSGTFKKKMQPIRFEHGSSLILKEKIKRK